MISLCRSVFDRLMATFAGVSCVAMFAVVFASAFSRYVFNMPFQWSGEFARYAMIYGTMFGSVLALNRSQHIRFTVLVGLVGKRWADRVERVTDVFVVVFGIILAWSGYQFMVRLGGIESPSLGIPMAYAFAAMMVGGGCLAIAGALLILDPSPHKHLGPGEAQ
jgi:TRAP-type C4-dicarboxylate transport system permease small subunit